jgi:FkbM family methyltransferase
MNDQTIEALGALLAKQRSEVARTGQLEFNSTIMEALSTRQIILCGYDPILSPMMVYQLVREQYQIMEVADDERSGDRVFRHRALSTFELATKNIHKDAILLNHASHNRHAYQTFEKVADYLDKPIINPQQLAYISRQSDKPIYSTIDPEYYVTSIVNNADRLIATLHYLDDDRSRQVLLQVILGRLTIDYKWFWKAYSPVGDMYFPDFFNYHNDEVFVDAGAFDGKDTLRFLRRSRHHFKAIYLFEISPSNLQKIAHTLDELDGTDIKQRVHVIPSGLWHKKGELTFSGEGLYAMLTAVQLAGREAPQPNPCRVTDLDSVIDTATLIKFEIEGAEMRALEGARGIIAKCRPNMAISAYHLSNDIVNIIDFLRNLDLGYRFRIRHHWGSDIRTIVYAATSFSDS